MNLKSRKTLRYRYLRVGFVQAERAGNQQKNISLTVIHTGMGQGFDVYETGGVIVCFEKSRVERA